MYDSYEERATKILKEAYESEANFRDGQLESILAVLEKKKVLIVQKTGWGKSIVYFVATKILRENGAGPTIIVSPLLSLMKNQVDSAKKIGIHAITINSDNSDEHDEIYSKLDTCDAIIISPERLSNDKFMEKLSTIKNVQLFVVDEAHSISDWGHDFRPDYQRIVKLLDNFPNDIAILGTTATANTRVINDIKNQLGTDLEVVRGDLIRKNIAIQINPCQTREERLAWLVQYLTSNSELKNKQGIIYCLTQRDCDRVATFLKMNGILAESYHSGLGKDSLNTDISQERLQKFDEGSLEILVATIKLGMGYDKSNIRFIIHYQMPQNIISYYQQIGRAGRDGEKAYAILLHGKEDEEIVRYFMNNSFIPPNLLEEILKYTEKGVKKSEILSAINISQSKLSEALKYLLIHDYIYKNKAHYLKNPTLKYDIMEETKKQNTINAIRQLEFENLMKYLNIQTCYMKYIADELDAQDVEIACESCKSCKNEYLISILIEPKYLENAKVFLGNSHGEIKPRSQWGNRSKIPDEYKFKQGKVLCDDYYSEVGLLVKNGKYQDNNFSDELIEMSVDFLKNFISEKSIDLIVAVPSLRRPNLVTDFTKKLATRLSIEFEDAVTKTQNAVEQKSLLNSVQQQQNIETSILVSNNKVIGKTILLVDDMVDSRWSFTVIAAELLKSGAKAVYPYALVKTGSGD